MWIERQITRPEELVDVLLTFGPGWMFRGHRVAKWQLQPTIERLFSPSPWSGDVADLCERDSIDRFSSKAHHYLSTDLLPSTKLGWLALMQHHGVPTRLLDFTLAPFFALFFAFSELHPTDDPCAVWSVDYRAMMKRSVEYLQQHANKFNYIYPDALSATDSIFKEFIDGNSHDILWATEPKTLNARLERQRGTFLLSCNIHKTISDLIPSCLPRESIQKVVIPASMAKDVFRILESMGIDNCKLFADVDGLANDIRRRLLNYVTHSIPRKTSPAWQGAKKGVTS